MPLLLSKTVKHPFAFLYNKQGMRTFILLSGLPGSGKSYWAKQFKKTHQNVHIVSSDDIRETHFGAIQNFHHEQEVWKIFLEDIKRYGEIEDSIVIADATNLQNKYRKSYYENTPEFDHHILVYFDIPFEICQKLNRTRAKGKMVDEDAMHRLHEELEEPSEEVLSLYEERITLGMDFIREAVERKLKESI